MNKAQSIFKRNVYAGTTRRTLYAQIWYFVNQMLKLTLLPGYLRVCTYCCKVVLSYAQNPEVSGDLGALSEDLHHLSSGAEPESSGSTSGQGQTPGQGQDVEWVTPSKRKARQMTSHSIFEADISKQRLVQ